MLTQEQINQLEEQLTQAIDKHLAAGGKLVSGNFVGYGGGEMCPIACLTNGRPEGGIAWEFALGDKLGFRIDTLDMWVFIQGFDNREMHWEGDPTLYQLGQKLRQKYLP